VIGAATEKPSRPWGENATRDEFGLHPNWGSLVFNHEKEMTFKGSKRGRQGIS
jgi:hypothetical protein